MRLGGFLLPTRGKRIARVGEGESGLGESTDGRVAGSPLTELSAHLKGYYRES